MIPVYTKPIQDNGQIIKGNLKAVEVEVNGQRFWVNSTQPVAFNQNGERITFELAKKQLLLPYELVLDQFKMDTDPGTNNPASYESFVTLFKGNEGSTKHRVFMNNPLKYKNFTFYQASYFQTNEGPYGSVLSVNFDPGRFWKYLGSFLLVFGSIWHFVLRKKPILKPGEARA
jgi:cytochrome c biogenesis protein ResB